MNNEILKKCRELGADMVELSDLMLENKNLFRRLELTEKLGADLILEFETRCYEILSEPSEDKGLLIIEYRKK